MEQKEFNLIEEPWILVLTREGKTEPVSLHDLFLNAHQLYSLAGELPTVDVAVLRFLLGVLYAVFGRQDLEGNEDIPESQAEALQRWKALWTLGAFPMAPILDYLEEVKERFYLFHPHTPFYQVMVPPDAEVSVRGQSLPLNPAEKEVRYLIGDLAESGNKVRWFTSRTNKDEISYPEAARWLLHMNAFDVSPGGAPPAQGFRANGYRLPWSHTLGLVWAEGDNLFETLMLNLALAPAGQDPYPDFYPSWGSKTPFSAQELTEIDQPFPQDPCALYTFPFRRMQLSRTQDGRIDKLILWGGHKVDGSQGNRFVENMTMWRQDKKGVHVPKTNDPARLMWRDLSSLLPGTCGEDAPGVLKWISKLKSDQGLSLPRLRLKSAGTVLAKSTAVTHVFSDSLRFHLSLLDNLEDGFAVRATGEVGLADRMVWAVGVFASDLVRAGGGSGDKDPKAAREKAMEQGYFLLDQPYRQWLEDLQEGDDIDAACRAWRETERRALSRLALEMVQRAGLKAMVGRIIKEKDGEGEGRPYAAPQLYGRLINQLRRMMQS